MTTATQAEQARDSAIEQFNEVMSNACSQAEYQQAINVLALRLGSMADAERMAHAWIAQQRQAAREVRQ